MPPINGPRVRVKNFIYRGVPTQVFKLMRGEMCCNIFHHPEKDVSCRKCQRQLRHLTIYNLKIGNTELEHMDFSDVEMASKVARQIIDDNLPEDELGLDHEEDLIDEDPDNEPDIVLNDPPSDAPNNKNGGGQVTISGDMVKQMDKLGWLDWALVVVSKKK